MARGLNTFNAQTDLGAGLQNIALAMFGGGAGGGARNDQDAHAALYEEQANDLVQKRAQEKLLLAEHAKRRTKANAAFISAKTGLDPMQAAGLIDNVEGVGGIPNPPVGFYPYEQRKVKKIQENAALSAIAASMMDDPTKAGAGYGNTNNMEQAYGNALENGIRAAILNKEITLEQAAQFNAAGGKKVYSQSVQDGTSYGLNELTGKTTFSESPIAKLFAENKKMDTVYKKEQANSSNATAGAAGALKKQRDAERKMLETSGGKEKVEVADPASSTGFSYVLPDGGRLVGAPPANKPAQMKLGQTYIGDDPNGNPQFKVVPLEKDAVIVKPPKGNGEKVNSKLGAGGNSLNSDPRAAAIKNQLKSGLITKEQARERIAKLGYKP